MPEIIEDNELENLTFSTDETPVAPKSRHYIDDDHLTGILSAWKGEYDAAKAAGEPNPRLPEAVGEAILDMAESMGKRHNFSGYSYLDEMKSDAVIHCVKYIHNFNPAVKSEKKQKTSAFGYINMIIWRSFTNRIKGEKREQYLKYKSFELMGGMDAFRDDDMNEASGGSSDDGGGMSVGLLGADFIQKAREYEQENGLNVIRSKEKKVAFDNFMFDIPEQLAPLFEDVPEDIDLALGENLEIEFE
jgi:hypothetical protein